MLGFGPPIAGASSTRNKGACARAKMRSGGLSARRQETEASEPEPPTAPRRSAAPQPMLQQTAPPMQAPPPRPAVDIGDIGTFSSEAFAGNSIMGTLDAPQNASPMMASFSGASIMGTLDQQPLFCNQCGNKLIPAAKFCNGCGTKVQPAAPPMMGTFNSAMGDMMGTLPSAEPPTSAMGDMMGTLPSAEPPTAPRRSAAPQPMMQQTAPPMADPLNNELLGTFSEAGDDPEPDI